MQASMNMPDLFENLRRKKTIIQKARPHLPVFFQLATDEHGAYIRVVDENGQQADTRPDYYTGPTRQVLKFLSDIRVESNFKIEWEKAADQIYLHENPYIIELLQPCQNFVDARFNKPIRFVEGVAKLVLVLDGQDEILTGRVTIHHQGEEFADITMLTRSHALSQGLIFRIQPVGEQPTTLKLFETSFSLAQIEKYLSLLFSLFNNVSVRYKDYRVVAGAPKHTQPTLIFEKIDSNNALYLRVTNSLPGFDSDFFEQYDINRISFLNDLDKNIIVSEVIPGELYPSFDELEKL
ncbi:MAG: hypothetical protein HQK58_17540, partial [Deltaproteobacteria bacterium]|nr:hypothetical protein [Deltaproteobacteria bacterium]